MTGLPPAFLIGAAILLGLNWLLRWAAAAEEREEERKRQQYMHSRTYYLRPAKRVSQDALDEERRRRASEPKEVTRAGLDGRLWELLNNHDNSREGRTGSARDGCRSQVSVVEDAFGLRRHQDDPVVVGTRGG